MKTKRYRIVSDNYLGYEVQTWRIWFPFWVQVGFSNTHESVARAIEYIKARKPIYVDADGNKL